MFRIISFLVLFFWFRTIFAAPAFATNHFFPTAYQSKNACYFTSVNIALEAKYGTKLRLKKVLQVIGFDGKTLATWEFKKNFSDLTHIVIAEYSTKTAFKKLIDRGEPVLVSTEISVVGVKWKIRHVSVAYSYDDDWLWVSDPLDSKRKRLDWQEVFLKNGKTRFYNLRTVSVKPYSEWNDQSKARERKEDIWIGETEIIH